MKQRILLLKSWTNKFGRKYPVGQIIQCDKTLRDELVNKGIAQDYNGKYPPVEKIKTDFFN